MTAMNETSTITLPEYHNLLALLLLNLNTPSVSSSYTTQEEEMIKKREEETMLTQNQVQDSRTEQVIKHHTWRKRQTSHTRHAIKKRETSVTPKKKNRQNQSTTNERANTNHTPERRITPQRDKKKKEKPHDTFPPHQPASPRDSSRHRPASNHPSTSPSSPTLPPHLLPSPIPTPYPHTVHTPTDTCYHPLSTYCLPPLYTPPVLPPIVTVPPPVSTFLPATVPIPVSVSLPLALNLCSAPCRSLRHATACCLSCLPVPLPSDCCPHTVHMSVCTTALVCYSTMPTVLGSATVLTTLHRPHPLRVTPAACATTSPLRESTHTPCRFHHPYRSLTLAHRVVPPLVVPVPSLAVSGVRLSCVVSLAGESPLADAHLRLTPMVTCCSLPLARIHAPRSHHYCQHSLLAHMLTVLYPRLLTYLPSFLSTSLLATFIQSCQHDAASIVHQIRQSPKPPQCNHT